MLVLVSSPCGTPKNKQDDNVHSKFRGSSPASSLKSQELSPSSPLCFLPGALDAAQKRVSELESSVAPAAEEETPRSQLAHTAKGWGVGNLLVSLWPFSILYMYTYTYVYIRMYTCIHIYIYIYVDMYIRIHICVYISRYMYLYIFDTHIIHAYIYMYTYIYMFIYVYIYMYKYALNKRCGYGYQLPGTRLWAHFFAPAQPRPVDGRIETLKAFLAFLVVVAVETWPMVCPKNSWQCQC